MASFSYVVKECLDLAKHFLEHHLKLALCLVGACVLIVVVAVVQMNPSFVKVHTEHVTVEIGRELKTEIGTIRPEPPKTSLVVAGLADGLHEQFYTTAKEASS